MNLNFFKDLTMANDAGHFEALDAHHLEIAQHITALGTLAKYIDDHGIDDHARQQARTIEAFFSSTSRQHHAQEERYVFPTLLASGDAAMATAVQTLQQDHGWIEENWIEVGPRLRAIASGNGWTDPAEFQSYVDVFTALMREHISLEERLIYPQAKALWAQALSQSLRL